MTAFYDQLLALLHELKDMYPEDPDFPLGITTLKMMKSVNPGFVVNTFYESSKAFEGQIIEKNEGFFLDHDFAEFSDELDFDILTKLKQCVKTMDAASKESVWVYVQNLYKIAKLVAA
jgi:hypothetical protein